MKKTRKIKRGSIAILFLSLSFLLPNCSKSTEPAPFADGMYLEYKVGRMTKIYKIHTLGSNDFKIVQTTELRSLPDDVEELHVNTYGRVYKSSFEPHEGKFSPIWIPVNKLEIGDNFDEDYSVQKKDLWKKWEVLVVKDKTAEVKKYFSLSTGFLVGYLAQSGGRSIEAVLVSTNVPGITTD